MASDSLASTAPAPASKLGPSESTPRESTRPSSIGERLGQALLHGLSPRLPRLEPAAPPAVLEPAVTFEIARSSFRGTLRATWFPAAHGPRGVVLMAHPWHGRGQAYFHRHRRIPSLQKEGYDVMTFDFGGVGGSGPRRRGFADLDVRDAVDAACRRAAGLPVHFWGVCLGGYWSALAMIDDPRVRGALFEDVTRHPLIWSHRQAPWGRPAYLFFEHALPGAYRFLDLFTRAQRLRGRSTAWVSGAWNDKVRPGETQALARLSGGRALIVQDADHLECMRRGRGPMVELALQTFASAE